jgi:release factor glutamine methyltransferase
MLNLMRKNSNIASLIADVCIPQHEAQLIMSWVLDIPRTTVIARDDQLLSFWDKVRYLHAINKRKKGVPIAYITKKKAFFGHEFLVNKHTLIPRPDTEILVEQALALLKSRPKILYTLDIGTGSGCIAISIAQAHRATQVIASDISRHALAVAQKNAQRLDAQVTYKQGAFLEPHTNLLEQEQTPLLILANLPYVREDQYQSEPSIWHEPKTALTSDDFGLQHYKELVHQLISMRKTLPWYALLEIDPDQEEQLRTFLQQKIPDAETHIHHDLAGHARVLQINKKQTS